MENKRLSMDELSQKLVNSKKVMNKVDRGDFSKGNINASALTSNPKELVAEHNTPPNPQVPKKPQQFDPRRIQESKLPDAIKKAMMDNPIPQIGLDSNLDMDFVEKTRALMEQDGQYVANRPVETSQQLTAAPSSAPSAASSGDLEARLTPIIENVIRKTLEEIVDKKLTQILMAQDSRSINEGLAIKVGNTIFTGKINKAKTIK